MQSSRRTYDTIHDIAKLDDYDHTRATRRLDELQFHCGYNRHIVEQEAAQRYDIGPRGQWVISMGDGTRLLRMVEEVGGLLVGHEYPADISLWPEAPGLPIPIEYEDVVKVVKAIRNASALSHEVHKEVFRPLFSAFTPMLVHTIYPKPSKGFSGILHAKMWMWLIGQFHKAKVNVVGWASDFCATGITAGRVFSVPSAALLGMGFKYLGLPDEDYHYFAVYAEPLQEIVIHGITHKYLPPPKIFFGDISHHVRNFRRNMANDKIRLIFWTEKDVALEGIVEGWKGATFFYLRKMATNGRQFRGFGLSDMVNINSWFDQRNDAAFNLITLKTIALLEKEEKNDVFTAMAMRSMFFFAEPFRNPQFINPLKIVEYVWRAVAVWEYQVVYVSKVAKIGRKLFAPSYQFLEGLRLMAAAATNFVLAFHRHREDTHRPWSDLGLARANNDGIEGLHSEERVGGVMTKCGGTAVTLAQSVHTCTRLTQVTDRQTKLRAADVIVGATRSTKAHLNDSFHGRSLGLFEACQVP